MMEDIKPKKGVNMVTLKPEMHQKKKKWLYSLFRVWLDGCLKKGVFFKNSKSCISDTPCVQIVSK